MNSLGLEEYSHEVDSQVILEITNFPWDKHIDFFPEALTITPIAYVQV